MWEMETVVAGITGKVKLATGLPELESGFPCGQRQRAKACEAVSSLQVVRGGNVGTKGR